MVIENRAVIPEGIAVLKVLKSFWEFVVRCVSSGAFPFLESRKI